MVVPYTPPVLSVEWLPGKGPLDFPNIPGWVPLEIDGETRLLSFDMSRGRRDVLERFGSTTVTVRLDNADLALDELNPSGLVFGASGVGYVPMRIRAYDAVSGETSTVASGYVSEGWRPIGDRWRGGRAVEVQLIDWLAWAALRVTLPDSKWATYLAASSGTEGRPTVWWRGDSKYRWTGSNTSGGRLFDSGTAQVNASGLDPFASAVADPLISGESNPAQRLWGGKRISSVSGLSTSATRWLWSCVFQVLDVGASGVRLVTARTGGPAGNARWSVRVGINGNVQAEAYNSSGVSVGAATIPVAHNDGRPHIVIAGWSKTFGDIFVMSDLGLDTAGLPGTAVNGGGFLTAGDAGSARVLLDEFAYWDASLYNLPQPEDLAMFLDEPDGIDLFDGGIGTDDLTLDGRVSRIFNLAGHPTLKTPAVRPVAGSSRPASDRKAWPGPLMPSGSLAESLIIAGESLGGATYCLRDGRVRVRSHGDLYDPTGSNELDYGTYVAELTDDDSPATPLPVVRASGRGRTGKLTERIINEVDAGRAFPDRDLTSIGKWGPHTHEMQSQSDDLEVAAICADLIAARRNPTYELAEVTIRPWGDQVATRFVLGWLELDKPVIYTEHDPEGSVALVAERPMRVQSESWSWQNGSDWTVTIGLAGDPDPAFPVVRVNRCTNPSFTVDLSGWTGSGAVTLARASTTPVGRIGAAFLRCTWAGTTIPYVSHTVTGLTVGRQIRVTAWVSAPSGQELGVISTGTSTPAGPLATMVGLGVGNLRQVRLAGTVTATSATFGIGIGLVVAAGQFLVHGVLIEESGVHGEFFDGSSLSFPDQPAAFSWTGTPDASPSTQIPVF